VASVLIDTCVIIDYLRGRAQARAFLRAVPETPLVSVVTVAELHAGLHFDRQASLFAVLRSQLHVIDVDFAIARQAGLYRRQYSQSHGVEMLDALIAATAKVHGVRLVTRNARHFPMLADLLVPYP
jgi:predicted nucleic acid-binding protein